ncbi:hypothetical protein ACQY0O_007570 [Thecaphora frezii]
MSGLASFVVLVTAMGIGTLVCGLIPLSLPLSRKALRVLEVFSAGLLIGAAVTVVIPEGAKALAQAAGPKPTSPPSASFRVGSLPDVAATASLRSDVDGADWAWSFITKRQEHSNGGHHDNHGRDGGHASASFEHLLGSSILCGFLLMFVVDQIASSGPERHGPEHALSHRPATPRRPEAHRLSRSFQQRRLQLFAQVADEAKGRSPSSAASPSRHAHGGTAGSRSSSSDLDNFPDDYDDERLHPNSPLAGHTSWESEAREIRPMQRADSSAPLLPQTKPRRPSNASFSSSRSALQRDSFRQVLTTLIGLLIHAFADGIAMGASAGSRDGSLTLIVFFSIMVHKAPASFGLCTLLISQRLSKANIRKGVAVFSLASPLGAITTYGAISMLFSNQSSGIDAKHIGIALLFSGGTFLFVAMHAVSELASEEADLEPVAETQQQHATSNSHGHGGGDPEAQREASIVEREVLGKVLRMALFILGSATPTLLQKVVGLFRGGHH